MRKKSRVVVFLGPDGAGKTTIISLVEDMLVGNNLNFARYYFAPGFLKRYRPKEVVSVTTDPHEGRQYGIFFIFIKISLMLFEFRMGLPKAKCANEILIFDRFIHDVLVDPRRYRMGITRWWMRLMLKLAPLPDICIIITAPVSVIQARKQEVSVEETARQIEEYKALSRFFPRSILVDNIGSAEEKAKLIVKEIVAK